MLICYTITDTRSSAITEEPLDALC